MNRSRAAILVGVAIAIAVGICFAVSTSNADAVTGELQTRAGSLQAPHERVGSDVAQLQGIPGLVGAMPLNCGFESGMGPWTQWYEDPNWGITSYRAAGGTKSLYCAGSTYPAPGPYPNNLDTVVQAGPYDLSSSSAATLEFDMYLDSEDLYDWCFARVSSDDNLFVGQGWSGHSAGWEHMSLDLSAVPLEGGGYVNMLGEPSVWVAFEFVSDGDTNAEGAYIDNVQLITDEGPPSAVPTITSLTPDSGSMAGNKTVVIAGAQFLEVQDVTFDGVSAAYTVDSPSQITATTPAHAAGTVNVVVTNSLGSSVDSDVDDYTYLDAVTYSSIRGTDRYDTAVRISKAMFPGALPAGAGLVLAPGETFPEALCGAPLATLMGGPVLLTPSVGLNNGVRAEMLRLAPQTVVCIGLSTAVVSQVSAAMGAGTDVVAIRGAGGSAYDMSYQVAMVMGAVYEELGVDMSDVVAIVTRGNLFPDAIGVSPLACYQSWPIILTSNVSGSLGTSGTNALTELGITQAIKVGTYVGLPAGVIGVANLSAADRYYTNANVVSWAWENTDLSFAQTAFATGDKFPDALAAGPYLARDAGILLLSPLSGPLPVASITPVVVAHAAEVEHVTFIACIEPVIGQVKALLP